MTNIKSHRRRAFAGIWALILVVLLSATWLALRDHETSADVESVGLDDHIRSRVRASVSEELSVTSEPKAKSDLSAAAAYSGVLDPAVVIDNPECDVGEGSGAAEGVAVVVIPTPTGSRFSVLDGDGAIFGDELPFNPNVQRIGRRTDGTVVVALADTRSDPIGAPKTPKPMRVYIDGVLIYEQETVWGFDVANDGSSFYAIEPLPGDTSRLVINSLDLRLVSHFDLDRLYTPWKGYSLLYVARFATDHASVMFEPAYADSYGRGTHWFFPVDGGERWSVVLPDAHDYESPQWVNEALFATSTEAFVVESDEDPKGGQPFTRIVKRSYEPALHQDEFKMLWSRTLDLDSKGPLELSANGKWLAIGNSDLHVLNAETGETVFAFPTLENLNRRLSPKERRQVAVHPDGRRQTYESYLKDVAALARLRSVLGPDASLADVGASGIRFRGDRLLMYRTTGDWPNRRRYYDVFDLEGIDVNGPPAFSIELNRDYGCHAGDFYTQGLQVHDGELTYLTTAR